MEINMNLNLWAFLSICVISSIFFTTFVIYLKHKETIKKLELDAIKDKNQTIPIRE